MAERGKAPTTKRYTAEHKQRAVRMVRRLRAETGQSRGTIQRVVGRVGSGWKTKPLSLH